MRGAADLAQQRRRAELKGRGSERLRRTWRKNFWVGACAWSYVVMNAIVGTTNFGLVVTSALKQAIV